MAGPSSAPGVFRVGSCVLYGAVVLLRRHRMPPAPHRLLRAATGLAVLIATTIANAQPAETVGTVAMLPEQAGPHWFWLSDIILHRTALFDADSGELLGTITSGSPGVGFAILPLPSPDHREIYLAESYFSRGVRGERTDVVTVYDGRTLAAARTRSVLPPKRAEYFPGNASNALSDDGRFIAVFNLTPMTSLSIVDVQRTHASSPRCRRPGAAWSTPPARGGSSCCARTARPCWSRSTSPGRRPSRAARASSIRRRIRSPRRRSAAATSGSSSRSTAWSIRSTCRATEFKPGEPWPLFDDADRHDSWRIGGGAACSALHAPSGPALRARAPGRPRHAQGGRARRSGCTTSRRASACSASRC